MHAARHGSRLAPIVAALVALGGAASAHAQLRVVTYNTYNAHFELDYSAPRESIGTVFEGLAAQARPGFARPLDIVLLQEQTSVSTTTAAYASLLNDLFGPGTYAAGALNGASTGGGRPGVVYNQSTVQLVAEQAVNTTSSSGAARATIRYQFRPVGYDSAADFYVYNSHFKASDTVEDRDRRGVEAAEVRANADALGAGVRAIYAGDFNFYRSSEPGFVNLTAAGPGQAFDPVESVGTWTNNSAFKAVHTQSPVTTAQFSGQATGGMDDRFDFQLVTDAVRDGRGFDYLPGSYWAFGNTGTHTSDAALSTGSVTALQGLLPGYTTEQTTAVIDALMASSDHLPVVADYQLPARLAVAAPELPAAVLRGAAVAGNFAVSNAAPVAVAVGADRLDYTVLASGGLAATGSGSLAALSAATSHAWSLDTAAAGERQATLTVATTSPQAAAGPFTRNYTVQVLDTASVQRAGPAGPPAAFSGTYTFGSGGNVASFAYNGPAIDDLAVGDLAKVGVTTSSSSNNSRANGWPTGGTNGSDEFAGVLDASKYFEFTLTAAAGHTLAMESLSFGVGRSSTGPRQWQWRSSADGFAAAIDTYTTVNPGLARAGGVLTNPDSDSNWTGNVLDLSNAAFQGLGSLTFRFYGFNAESGSGTGGLQGPLSFAGSVVETGAGGGSLGPGDTLAVANAAATSGTQRAAAVIASRTLTGDAGWSVSGLAVGTSVAAAAVGSGTAAFDATGRLNGTYAATFTLGLEHDQSLPGATADDLGTLAWNLETTVAGRTGSGTAAVGGGASYAGLGLASGLARGSEAAVLAGTASDAATVSMSFAAAPTGDFVSDVLTLQGTAGDAIVLSLTYDAGALGDLLPGELFLGWLDTRAESGTAGEWVNSVLGNSANLVAFEAPYPGSWTAYAAAFSVGSPAAALGAWGVDSATTSVWAVVDHNSQFAVVPVPEPGTWVLLAAAAGVAWWRRRRPWAAT